MTLPKRAHRMLLGAILTALAATAQAQERPPRPDVNALPVSANATRGQLLLGDKIFHGEAARGTCFNCHGWDGKGTATGNDLTNGSLNWGESFKEIKATILNNMKLVPGQDGDLTPFGRRCRHSVCLGAGASGTDRQAGRALEPTEQAALRGEHRRACRRISDRCRIPLELLFDASS